MKYKRFVAALLFCILLFGCSFIPASATEAPDSGTVMLRVSGKLNHSFSDNRITPIGQSFFLAADDIIQYDCTYTPSSASVDFGYINPNGEFCFKRCTSGSISRSFQVASAGSYTLAIRNNSSQSVTVTGTVKY